MMFSKFLGVALCAAPFFIKAATTSMPSLSQTFFLQVVAFLGVLIFGVKIKDRRLTFMAIAVFFVSFVSSDPFGVFQYYQLGSTVAGVVFIALLTGHMDENNIGVIYKSLAFICITESLWVLLNVAEVDLYQLWFSLTTKSFNRITISEHITGSMGNPNHSGALIAATLPFLYPLYWGIPIVALFFLKGALPAICAGVSVSVFYCYKTKKFKYLYLIAGSLFTAGLSLMFGLIPHSSFFSDTHRVTAWKKLFEMLGFQIFGRGFGVIPVEFSQYHKGGEIFMQMHNEWIEAYAIAGILGVLACIYLVIPSFKDKGYPAVNACLVSLLVNSLGNFTFHIAPLFMVFGACYAIQLSRRKKWQRL